MAGRHAAKDSGLEEFENDVADALPPDFQAPPAANRNSSAHLTILIAVPTLESGAADTDAIELAGLISTAGHRPIVVSRGGRLQAMVTDRGGEFIQMNVASKNPIVILRCAIRLDRIVRQQNCDVVHALGRAPGWSAYIAARLNRRPFVTTWHKGFREQNFFKRWYNSVMVRGERVIAGSEEIATLIQDRYRTPLHKLTVLPAAVDSAAYDPATVSAERVDRIRHAWGITPQCRVVLAPGRMVRRKGHHSIIQAAQRLKAAGVKDFMVVFTGEDQGRTRYTGDLWDLIEATGTNDVVRLAGLSGDLPAALAASTLAVFASTQTEGTQRTILGAQAMGLPVVASDLSAGPEIVLAPPAISEDRITGLRFSAGDSTALAAAITNLLGLSDDGRRAIGRRGRQWVISHHDSRSLAEQKLGVYVDLAAAKAMSATPA